jgi:hypothetical protein
MLRKIKVLLIILLALSMLSCYTYSKTGESCPVCYGSGKCNYCRGIGYIIKEGECLKCNGTGKCTYCAGTGRLVTGLWPFSPPRECMP